MLFSLLPLAAMISASPAATDPPAYLFDAIRPRTAYRIAWDRLVKDVQPTPDWLRKFDSDFDGVSGAIKQVTVDGKPYLASFVCKPTECAQHRFVVLFEANGSRALGALGGGGEPPAFFGNPSKDEQDALAKGF
ncbi:MAG: Ivy family c-type lysozyme inhibitor [Roseiarcus sp.]